MFWGYSDAQQAEFKHVKHFYFTCTVVLKQVWEINPGLENLESFPVLTMYKQGLLSAFC
jgi:hypothetical protein